MRNLGYRARRNFQTGNETGMMVSTGLANIFERAEKRAQWPPVPGSFFLRNYFIVAQKTIIHRKMKKKWQSSLQRFSQIWL
jgi:hypothetical protein